MTDARLRRTAAARGALRLSVPAALGLALGVGGAAAAEPFQVSTGHVIDLTPVETMDCGELGRKLDEIDATGYRGRRPRPPQLADRPLFDYESAVSHRFYGDCSRSGGTQLSDMFGGVSRPGVADR